MRHLREIFAAGLVAFGTAFVVTVGTHVPPEEAARSVAGPGDCTAGEVSANFGLVGQDVTDGQDFKSSFSGLNNGAQARQAMDIHFYLMRAESGHMTKAEFNAAIGTSLP